MPQTRPVLESLVTFVIIVRAAQSMWLAPPVNLEPSTQLEPLVFLSSTHGLHSSSFLGFYIKDSIR